MSVEPSEITLANISHEDIPSFLRRIEDEVVYPEVLYALERHRRTEYYNAAVRKHNHNRNHLFILTDGAS